MEAGPATDELAEALAQLVGEGHVLTDPDRKVAFETDWTGRFSGRARLVVRPRDTAEVAAALRLCSQAGAPVVPQGGNTGLVGGGVPAGGEVVLSLARLDEVGEVDQRTGQLTAGAGVTLARIQEVAAAAGLAYGVDFAARDSATVGGMIATNAGGIRVLRYGMTRHQVVGIEAVTVDGRIVTRMSGLLKDNTGYDLVGLLAGSEGTLAVITAARLRLVPLLDARIAALIAVADVTAAQGVLGRLRSRVTCLEAAELLLDEGLELVRRHAGAAAPFSATHPAYLLIECAAVSDPTEALATALADDPDVVDVAVATDPVSRARLWALREGHTEAINAAGVPIKLDVSLPASAISTFMDRLDRSVAAVTSDARIIVFGHLGDGNLHVNVLSADHRSDRVEDAVLRLTMQLGGSISAEHGIGRAKSRWLADYLGATDVALSAGIRAVFDPSGLLNPGVLTPAARPERGRTDPRCPDG